VEETLHTLFFFKEFVAKEKLVIPSGDHPQGENC